MIREILLGIGLVGLVLLIMIILLLPLICTIILGTYIVTTVGLQGIVWWAFAILLWAFIILFYIILMGFLGLLV